jgi:hypothetical protein
VDVLIRAGIRTGCARFPSKGFLENLATVNRDVQHAQILSAMLELLQSIEE